jgi:serine/threonine-protein kinase RsbW
MPAPEDRRVFRSDVAELRRMADWWQAWAARAGVTSDRRHDGELCLHEAMANVILHGCSDGGSHVITLALESRPDAIRATLADDGRPFDPVSHPAAAPPDTLETAREGGLGLGLIRDYAEAVEYRREGNRNVLTLTLRRA